MKLNSLKIVFCIAVLIGCESDNRPKLDVVKALFTKEKIAEFGKGGCPGKISVQKFNVVKIGKFNKRANGFPLYIDFSINCIEGEDSFDFSGNANQPTSFIRSDASGALEVFNPLT